MITIPEMFLNWLNEFCQTKVLIRVFFLPRSGHFDTSATKAVEAVTRWRVGEDAWVRFVLYEHEDHEGGVHIQYLRPSCDVGNLANLVSHWQNGGVWTGACCDTKQLMAFTKRGQQPIKMPTSHPSVLMAVAEMYGFLSATTGHPEVPVLLARHLLERLQELLVEYVRKIEFWLPLSIADE